MINLKYNKQTPCHVAGFVVSAHFLNGIVSTSRFAFISGYCSQFYFEERLQNFSETPDLFLVGTFVFRNWLCVNTSPVSC